MPRMTAAQRLEEERERRNYERYAEILKGIEGINERLDALNGRTRENSEDIAVLKERNPSKQGGAWGALAGGITGLLSLFAK